jgi:FkbM family methyltransferase
VAITSPHDAELRALLNASSDELTHRATSLFERESGARLPVPLVLCGAGHLGRIVAGGLGNVGTDVLAFADNDVRRHGQKLGGIPIISVRDAVDRYGDRAVFVITVYTARPLRRQLRNMNVRVASSRALMFQYPNAFLPYASVAMPGGIPDQRDAILAGLEFWGDDESRSEYVSQVAWQVLARESLPDWTPPEQTYFPDGLITLGEHERFVDCGAFNGDSVREFIARVKGRFDRIIALEPDPSNCAALDSFVKTLPPTQRDRVEIIRAAAHSSRQTLRFVSASGAGSTIAAQGDIDVRAERLDDIIGDVYPTFIKMDIEGAEPEALRGAGLTLKNSAPTLAVCLYHQREHLWEIPSLIRRANADYRLFLRRHSDESWETVCYALANR